jgi:DNA-binding transcriptional ArsR family regulator
MSRRASGALAARELQLQASIFAALGDRTRLSIVATLSAGTPQSVTQLTEGSKITRQAISKHLRVLEGAGMVRSVRAGRETLFKLEAQPLESARDYLQRVSAQWDETLARLKSFVETTESGR